MISQICTTISAARAAAIQTIFDAICVKYGITVKNDQAAFVAQICHESGEFTIKTENMNYTTPQRIVDIWPSRFNLDGSNGKHNANDYIRNPQKLANEVYANRMGNGDANSGDGFLFRGAGFLQMTGREDFQKYAAYIGKDLTDTSNLVRSDDTSAMDAAAWEYVIKSKLLGQTDFRHITIVINGGTIGLEERTRYYNKALAVS
jgi:putative chitinase